MIPNFLHLPTYAVDYHYKTLVMRLSLPAAPGPDAPLHHQAPLTHRRARRAQLNTSRDAIAYNVIDMDGFPDEASAELQQALLAMEAVISTRIIWTGSAAEGPANFFTKG